MSNHTDRPTTDPKLIDLLTALQGSGKELEALGALQQYRQDALDLAGQPDAEQRIEDARNKLRERLRALQSQ